MYASTSLSSHSSRENSANHQRVSAAAAASFKVVNGNTRLDRLYQQGSAKIRFPKNEGTDVEAVLINTAGGLTGGDQLSWDLRLRESTEVVATTQACEKAYRSSDGIAQLGTQLHLGSSTTLHWLPQETILYDGSALNRTFDVTMERRSTLLALESIVLGREAMGETVTGCLFRDRWRIRREGKLIFADDLKLEGKENALAGMSGNRALASLLFIGDQDEEQMQALAGELRKLCPLNTSGFSAFNGKVTGRILAQDSYSLRHALVPVLKFLRGSDLPRVWRI
ncbi:MAG: urease accessory protein UreD [Pseudomonadota bacterium]